MQRVAFLIVLFSFAASAQLSFAEHPVDVQRFAAAGEYLKALVAYERIPKRVVTEEARMAAAKSAWALGWVKNAVEKLDQLLGDSTLSTEQRSDALLTRAIIEFQEGQYQLSDVYVEKALRACGTSCPRRSVAFLLWGESLAAQGAYGAAETKFSAGLEGAVGDERIELSFQRGLTRERLGKSDEARSDFTQVPLKHERTPEALRALAGVALDQNDLTAAKFWLERGRALYPERFLDSWVDYALVQVTLKQGDLAGAREIEQRATQKYPPSDAWLTMLHATLEANAWAGGRTP